MELLIIVVLVLLLRITFATPAQPVHPRVIIVDDDRWGHDGGSGCGTLLAIGFLVLLIVALLNSAS